MHPPSFQVHAEDDYGRMCKEHWVPSKSPISRLAGSIRRSLALVIGCIVLWTLITVSTWFLQPGSALPGLFGQIGFGVPNNTTPYLTILEREPGLYHASLDSEEHCDEFDRVVSSSRGRFFAGLAAVYHHSHYRRVNALRHSRTVTQLPARVCKNVHQPLMDGPIFDGPQWTQTRQTLPLQEHSMRLDALRETRVLYARPAAEWHDEL